MYAASNDSPDSSVTPSSGVPPLAESTGRSALPCGSSLPPVSSRSKYTVSSAPQPACKMSRSNNRKITVAFCFINILLLLSSKPHRIKEPSMPTTPILTKFLDYYKGISEISRNCFFQFYPEIPGILGARDQNCRPVSIVSDLIHPCFLLPRYH